MSPSVSLAADRRGRVPFAVVGVLLLVASLALAPTLSPGPTPEDTAVERTLTEVTAASETAVRDGAATASRRAAAAPVVEPADTPVGRALSDGQPFRDSLRLRVYLQVRANLDRLSARTDGVQATASLPPVNSTDDYGRAIHQVSLQRAGENDTAMRVTVDNITLTARRDGEVISQRTISQTVVVPTPVLHVHEQVGTYEQRVTNGLSRPGLTQRLTARLYPIAWARGYAQFGGAPIENVVANRHVSLATNGALLGVQRSVFGRSDPEGRQALTEATAAVGLRDIVATTNSQLADQILSQANYEPASQNITTGGAAAPEPDDPMRIGVNRTADAAYREVGTPEALNATARDAYTVDAKVFTERNRISGGRPDQPDKPGPYWRIIEDETHSTARIVDSYRAPTDPPDGWHALDRFGRTVEITHTRFVTWRRGNTNQLTRNERTERVRVTLVVAARHRNESLVPARGIETAYYEDESPLGGQNLADIESRAERRLVGSSQLRAIKDVAIGEFQSDTVTITGARPDSMHIWMARDLRALRERVRDINVTTERGAVGSFQTNPSRRLLEKLRGHRSQLLDAPETYDSAAQRARVAARAEYLDAVERRLGGNAGNHSAVESGIDDQLRESTGGSLAELRRGLTARETQVPRTRPTPTGPAGPVRTQVEAQPQYLTLASVNESKFPAVDGSEHPLVARNVNVFSIPYGNAASAVVDAGNSGRNRAGLAAAARTLAAANETDPGSNTSLAERRGRLQNSVARANGAVVGALQQRVEAETDADGAQSRRIVSTAMNDWETTAARGLALANNSAAIRVAETAGDRLGLSEAEEDWLRLRLLRTTSSALSTVLARPPNSVVNRTANSVRAVSRDRVQTAIEDRTSREIQDVAEEELGTRALPAGLPIAPPLTAWYATLNIWWVTVKGTYARFSVTASHGTPESPGGRVRYVREDAAVTLDADGDGSAERLGNNTRISFRAETGVLIVVPPRPRGVGDKDGNSVETSPGWPEPG